MNHIVPILCLIFFIYFLHYRLKKELDKIEEEFQKIKYSIEKNRVNIEYNSDKLSKIIG